MFENGGFVPLQRNKYMRSRPKRLTRPYFYGEPIQVEPSETATSFNHFFEICYKVKDELGKGKMLDFKQYQEYLVFGKVPEPEARIA